jgi:hypothetical protein
MKLSRIELFFVKKYFIFSRTCLKNQFSARKFFFYYKNNNNIFIGFLTPDLNRQACLDSDFFRLMGYKGAMDAVYCGDERLSLKVGSNKTLAIIFQSKPRLESPFGEEMRHGESGSNQLRCY